jgi:hypothetical protein
MLCHENQSQAKPRDLPLHPISLVDTTHASKSRVTVTMQTTLRSFSHVFFCLVMADKTSSGGPNKIYQFQRCSFLFEGKTGCIPIPRVKSRSRAIKMK